MGGTVSKTVENVVKPVVTNPPPEHEIKARIIPLDESLRNQIIAANKKPDVIPGFT